MLVPTHDADGVHPSGSSHGEGSGGSPTGNSQPSRIKHAAYRFAGISCLGKLDLIRSSHAAACQQELFFSLNYTKYIGQILYLRISMLVKNWRSFAQTQTGFGGQNRERVRLIDGCNATSGTYQRSQKPDLYALPAQILCDRSHGPSAM